MQGSPERGGVRRTRGGCIGALPPQARLAGAHSVRNAQSHAASVVRVEVVPFGVAVDPPLAQPSAVGARGVATGDGGGERAGEEAGLALSDMTTSRWGRALPARRFVDGEVATGGRHM